MTNNPFSRSIPETLPQVNTTRLCFGKSKLASHTCCFSASNIDQKPPSLINNFLIWAPPASDRRWDLPVRKAARPSENFSFWTTWDIR